MSKRSHRNDKVTTTSSGNNDSDLFLRLVHRRYVKSLYGAVHGFASLLSLFFGNWILIQKVLLGYNVNNTLSFAFSASTFTSAIVTILFYWNKVQAYQLSTTTLEEKGMTPQQMQNFNRGRGTVTIAAHALLPLVVVCAPSRNLESAVFSSAFAGLMLIMMAGITLLVKDYAKIMILFYGGNHLGVALSILYHGSIANMIDAHPLLMEVLENEAAFVVSAVQFGFMWYYFHSRKLVSKSFIQEMCKKYHPLLMVVWYLRLQRSQWWSAVPWPLWPRLGMITVFGLPYVVKICIPYVVKMIVSMLKGETVRHISSKQESEKKLRREMPKLQATKSSTLKAQNRMPRRRSSLKMKH